MSAVLINRICRLVFEKVSSLSQKMLVQDVDMNWIMLI